MTTQTTRRQMLALSALGLAGGRGFTHAAAPSSASAPPEPLVDSISKEVVLRGRDGSGPTWFHPRACMIPGADGPTVFMTLQEIRGSDYFMPLHLMLSKDFGKTWSQPEPVPPLGRVPQANNDKVLEGVCDVVPEWHAPTRSVLALGHNVFYSGPRFSARQPARAPVYSVWKDGKWRPRRTLAWDDPRGAFIYTNNCGQRFTLPNGDIAMSFTYGPDAKKPRFVSGVLCTFDGEELKVKKVGPALENRVKRGLLEPSVTRFRDKFYLTIRAEDNRGYVSVSDDGLNYAPQQAWMWEDGTPLDLSTTQQHWLPHSEALWLVYTRKDATNVNVGRWRSPLWMAEVDLKTLRLRRDTEQVVLPLVGDGVKEPKKVAYMGNFHTVAVNPQESWVTVGEWQPHNGIKGDLLLARIRWNRPNGLVG